MKKVFLFIAIIAFGLVLVSCKGKEDPAEAVLQGAYDSLSALISDPSNITGSFEVPTSLANGVSASWTSSNPGVATVGTPSGGFANVTVNRPAYGEADVKVTLTVELSIPSELDEDEMLTKEWSIELTIKANTVAPVVIDSIADVLAITDPAYDGEYQVTLEDLTIFAKGKDAAFAYDGTGIIEVYSGDQTKLEVGKVYTIDATIEWYYGLWELSPWTAEEQTSATPQYPTAEVIASVDDKIEDLVEADQHTFSGQTAAAGNMEPIYATVTGRVYMIPEDTGNYNTYLVDTTYDTEQTWEPGSAEAPAQGFMFYYNTLDFDTIRLYDGIVVTIDIVIYTYRSNNQAFAIYYVGGPEGIEATLTDAQKLEIDSNAITLPESATEAGTLTLPDEGMNGSEIVWSFTDAENADNTLINLTTGAFTVPTGRQANVGLTATVTYGTLDPVVKTFVVKLGEYPLSTIDDVIDAASGTFRIQGIVLGYVANNTVAIQDATGGISVYNGGGLADLAALIGHEVEIIGTRGAFGGLIQLTGYTFEDLGEEDYPAAFDLQTLDEWNATTLVPYRTTRVSAANLKITAWTDANFGNIEMTLLDETTGNTLNFKWDSRVDIAERTFLEATKLGDYVTFTGAVLGWASNNPLLTLSHGSQISAGTAPVLTDANYVVLDAKAIDIVTSYTAAGDIVLPTTGANGTAIAWSFTDAEDVDNALIDLVELTVALPAEVGTVEVSLTATVTKGEASTTKAFVISIEKPAETPIGTPELFFSEYIEGSSNNKALELYNPTEATIDLSAYRIEVHSNGSLIDDTPSNSLDLTGTLASGEVYVIYNSSAVTDISTVGDVTSTVTYFNGDDIIVLKKDGVIIDVIGIPTGTDPGDGWEVGGVANATMDHTLVRKPNVVGPNDTWDPTEWTVYDNGTHEYLGSHTSMAPAEE